MDSRMDKKHFWLFTLWVNHKPVERVYRKDTMELTLRHLKAIRGEGADEGQIIHSVYLGFMTEAEFNG